MLDMDRWNAWMSFSPPSPPFLELLSPPKGTIQMSAVLTNDMEPWNFVVVFTGPRDDKKGENARHNATHNQCSSCYWRWVMEGGVNGGILLSGLALQEDFK